MKEKNLLLRLARDARGDILLDLSGKSPGRGAYICPDEACLQKAKKSRALERALRVKTEDTLWQQLREEISRRA
ncbi:MAG: YlxR family protein [Clostridiales bacterium]|nr:YlxR family protein [Clostridiales bacterium]